MTGESNWRTRVNLKHRTHAGTRNYSRFYCMKNIDLCSTCREQRIALLQALFKMLREGPAVLHFLWRHWGHMKNKPYFSTHCTGKSCGGVSWQPVAAENFLHEDQRKNIKEEMEEIPRQCGDKGLKSLQWNNIVESHLWNCVIINFFAPSNSKKSV